MLPLFSALWSETAVEFEAKSSQIISRITSSRLTAYGLRHCAYAVEPNSRVEGFGVGASLREACRRATIECADRWVTRCLSPTHHGFLAELRLHDRSIGIASSADRVVAQQKAQNDLIDKVEMAVCQQEFGHDGRRQGSREKFENGIHTVVLCEAGVFGAGSSLIHESAITHAEDEILLQKVFETVDDPLPLVLNSGVLKTLAAADVTTMYCLDNGKRFLVVL